MEQKQIEKFRSWFDSYVAGFYGDDEYVNFNLRLKEEHSRRTCEEMRYLTKEHGLEDNQSRIAETIALFHDIGRFRQFAEYRTYHDGRSVNHSLLGTEVLDQLNVLDGVVEQEKQWIEKAIEYHGRMELPKDLDGQCLLFSKLIRDADKLDIFYVAIEEYKQYRQDPDRIGLEIELPDEPGYTAGMVEAVLGGWRMEYSSLRTWNDMKLLQLSWVYDVNFVATLRRIRRRRFLEMVLDFLPETEDIEKVRKKVFEYVDLAIKQDRSA